MAGREHDFHSSGVGSERDPVNDVNVDFYRFVPVMLRGLDGMFLFKIEGIILMAIHECTSLVDNCVQRAGVIIILVCNHDSVNVIKATPSLDEASTDLIDSTFVPGIY